MRCLFFRQYCSLYVYFINKNLLSLEINSTKKFKDRRWLEIWNRYFSDEIYRSVCEWHIINSQNILLTTINWHSFLKNWNLFNPFHCNSPCKSRFLFHLYATNISMMNHVRVFFLSRTEVKIRQYNVFVDVARIAISWNLAVILLITQMNVNTNIFLIWRTIFLSTRIYMFIVYVCKFFSYVVVIFTRSFYFL